MARGEFDSILSMNAYQAAKKDWYIETLHSQIHWYDPIVNPHALVNTKKHIHDRLLELKQQVEEQLEKRFIYFIFSRTKIRFDVGKQPKRSFLTNKLKIYLLVGKQKRRVCVKVDLVRPEDNQPLKATVDDKFITIHISDEDQVMMSVHDFLMDTNTNLGFASKVEYVGYTKNPHLRPTNGAHAGLSNILHNVSNDENDIFIAFNLFKVLTQGSEPNSKMDFLIANSLSDEVNVDLEGSIIEKSLILYFDSNNQTANQGNERSELINSLQKLKAENSINSIQIHYEIDDPPSEYFIFYSDNVKPSIRHLFTVEEKGKQLTLASGSRLFTDSYNAVKPLLK